MPVRPTRALCSLLVASIAWAGCTSDDDAELPEYSLPAVATVPPSLVPPVTVAEGQPIVEALERQGGTVLATAGMVLYAFTPDEFATNPMCVDACAASWPPVVVAGDIVVGAGLDPTLFATEARTDGTQQLTVAGWPLYRFAADAEPGDARGQGMDGSWFMVTADGELLRDDTAG